MYRNFDELVCKVAAEPKKSTLAVAAAEDKAVIEAVRHAEHMGLVKPIYIGAAEKIRALLREQGANPSDCDIVSAPDGSAGQRMVELVHSGDAQVMMKGLMETKEFLGPIVKKENQMRTGSIMSHVVLFQLPTYHKLLMTTDGGMVMYPTLEEKMHIIENATRALRAMGYEKPAHAVVCAVEKVNPKMPETQDAYELMQRNLRGEIKDCTVIGPISYDVAMSAEIAGHKGFSCEYSGKFDCLIMPNIQAGNILGKCYTVTAGGMMAGIIMGAKAPAIMTSRGSDANEKFYSIAAAALTARGLANEH